MYPFPHSQLLRYVEYRMGENMKREKKFFGEITGYISE